MVEWAGGMILFDGREEREGDEVVVLGNREWGIGRG